MTTHMINDHAVRYLENKFQDHLTVSMRGWNFFQLIVAEVNQEAWG